MDMKNIESLVYKMKLQNEYKKINEQVLRRMEEKAQKDREHYESIRINLEKINSEAEKERTNESKRKAEELQKQISAALEQENIQESIYLKQRAEIAANTRKILEIQEKEFKLREQVKKYNEAFDKVDAKVLELVNACDKEMGASYDVIRKQFKDIRNYRENHRNSLENLNLSLTKLNELYQFTQNELIKYQQAVRERQALKLAEEKKKEEERKKELEASKQASVAQPVQQEVRQNQADVYKQLLASKKSQTKNLDENPALQQLRFALRKAITNPINLLNQDDRSTLVNGFQNLDNLLSGQRIQTTKGAVAITDHNEANIWCRLKIADTIFGIVDKDCRIVFFAASLVIALWQKYPDFGEIFMAHLYTECPFMIPSRLGLDYYELRSVNGALESYKVFESRVGRFASLLAAIWISFPRKGQQQPHPCGIENGWIFLASILNRPDARFLVLEKVLETAGSRLHQLYGKQFVKLMILLKEKYVPALNSNDETIGTFSRLRDSVAKFFHDNKFAEPKGKLANGYW